MASAPHLTSKVSNTNAPKPDPHNCRKDIEEDRVSKSYIVANQQSQHCFPIRADFCRVGAMVLDSVVVELGEGMWVSEEGDEYPG